MAPLAMASQHLPAMLELPHLPRSAFDLFVRARWSKAIELGQAPPSASRFRAALRIAYENLPDKREWEAMATEDEARFELEYQEALEERRQKELGIIFKKEAWETASRSDSSSTSKADDDDEEDKPNGSSITPPSFSSRTLDSNCSALTLESVWRKPRPCRSLMESGSSLSELAPFVAAILRDKVVSDLMRESDALRAEAKEHKTQKRRERIMRKAIFMVAAPCEPGPSASDPVENGRSAGACPRAIYCWATKYTASSSKHNNEKKMALLQSENRCKFRDLVTSQFHVHGERVGCFADDASHFSIKVFRNEVLSSATSNDATKKDAMKPEAQLEVMFFFTLGKHRYGFSSACKTSIRELLVQLGRPDFPASQEEIDWEKTIDMDFLNQTVKPESRVRFQWAERLCGAKSKKESKIEHV